MKKAAVIAVILSLLLPALLMAQKAIVARVNGAEITRGQLEETIEQMVPRTSYHGTLSEEKREDLREKALEALITTELQYQDAVVRGITVSRGEVKDELKSVRSSFRSSLEYKIWLQRSGLDEAGLKKRIERALMVRTAIARIVEDPARMSDDELQKYYDGNPGKFLEPESIRLRVISAASEKTIGQAAAALVGGESFASVAERLSEDDFRSKGGDAGDVRKGMLYPQLETAAFSLRKGEVSKPILAEGTWFLLKVEDTRPSRTLTFSESREKLKRELEKKKSSELLEKWLDGLRAKAEIILIPETDASR